MKLTNTLNLKRCPHCNIASPNIYLQHQFATTDANDQNERIWCNYVCSNCGGVTLASKYRSSDIALEIFPQPQIVEDCIPEKAKQFLQQAIETIHAPAGSIMLAASAIDAMLQEKGFGKGSLYTKIQDAATDHLITEGMAQWAHQIRLEANDQRHADADAALPNEEDAKRIVEFAQALAEFIYVLPNKVNQGIEKTKEQKQ
ncbi:MAG: hypothetical protein H6Q17_542 [Bacteroidetes bacterium]|nr:hypothetical protein [Bacteroidota bacterium]